jgi:hypothetical protein
MRWFAITLAVIIVLLSLYVGAAFSTLFKLTVAARSGDARGVMAHTDIVRLKRSVTDQVIAAYVDRLEQKRPLRPLERTVVNSVGTAIADGLVARYFTEENVLRLLHDGHLMDPPGAPSPLALPPVAPLSELYPNKILPLLKRIRLIKPVEFGIRVSKDAAPANRMAVRMHFANWKWKLAGLDLPVTLLNDLAARLPMPVK